MEADRVTICRSNPDFVVGFTRALVVAYWCCVTRPEDVLDLTAVVVRAHKASGKPVALIQLVSASAVVPDARARAALAAMLRELGGSVVCSAIVHEAEGFRAAMIRSIVTGLAALSNPGFPHRVFARVSEASAWTSQNQEHSSAALITGIVLQVRGARVPMKTAGPLPMQTPSAL